MRPFLFRLFRRLQAERAVVGVDLAVAAAGIVAVASVVGGIVVIAGVTGADRLDSTVQAALARTGSGLMVDGPVIARTDGQRATSVIVDVATLPGSQPVQLTADEEHDGVSVEYVDAYQVAGPLPFSVSGTADGALSGGATARIEVDLGPVQRPPGASDSFTLIVRPGDLPPLRIERTLPAGRPLDAVIVLN